MPQRPVAAAPFCCSCHGSIGVTSGKARFSSQAAGFDGATPAYYNRLTSGARAIARRPPRDWLDSRPIIQLPTPRTPMLRIFVTLVVFACSFASLAHAEFKVGVAKTIITPD